jgi:hypothetical protein
MSGHNDALTVAMQRIKTCCVLADAAEDANALRLPAAGGLPQAQSDAAAERSAVAIILDAEATSFLMMGSMSPGLKKHSVTLFEGGAFPSMVYHTLIRLVGHDLWQCVAVCDTFASNKWTERHTLARVLRAAMQSMTVSLTRRQSIFQGDVNCTGACQRNDLVVATLVNQLRGGDFTLNNETILQVGCSLQTGPRSMLSCELLTERWQEYCTSIHITETGIAARRSVFWVRIRDLK